MADPPIPPDEGDVLDEISELREDFREYADRNQNKEEIRRAESVHVLTALGVVGGYATFAATGRFPEAINDAILRFFVLISLLFLLAKLATITLRIRLDWDRLDWLDETVLPIGHSLSIFSLMALAVGLFTVRNMDFIPQEVLNVVFPLIGGLVFALFMALVMYGTARTDVKYQESLEQQFQSTLDVLRDCEAITEEKAEELEHRLRLLIVHRDELEWYDYLATLGDASPGELNRSDINRLTKVLNRLEVKVKNDTLDQNDIERLDEVITGYEER